MFMKYENNFNILSIKTTILLYLITITPNNYYLFVIALPVVVVCPTVPDIFFYGGFRKVK